MMKGLNFLFVLFIALFLSANVQASTLTGGDAVDQASADDILDIIFLIDTSGSMFDNINAIGAVAQSAIEDLQCPDCNVYVRATFAAIHINYYSNTVFNEVFSGTSLNSTEDNGWAAYDAINSVEGTWWTNDAVGTQDYYRAVVTIGDEGTEDGYPIYQNDWDAAYAANQAAIDSGVFLFSWVTDDAYTGVPDLFQKMATGGTGGGYNFGDTYGSFIDDTAGTGDVKQTLQDIICTAGSGGTINNPVPEPATMLLFGLGILGLAGVSRRKK